jgi:hypothetical protein
MLAAMSDDPELPFYSLNYPEPSPGTFRILLRELSS